jgi:hypothetical protein
MAMPVAMAMASARRGIAATRARDKAMMPTEVGSPPNSKLAVNLRTAKALGLAIPQSILARADELIE